MIGQIALATTGLTVDTVNVACVVTCLPFLSLPSLPLPVAGATLVDTTKIG